MNIAEAAAKALRGEKIRDGENGEWIIACSSGSQLRFHANRQLVSLSLQQIVSQGWQSETDFIRVSRSLLLGLLEGESLSGEAIQRVFEGLSGESSKQAE